MHAIPKCVFRLAAASLLMAGLLAAGAAGAQPAPTWDRILDAARKDGKVVLYTNTVPPVSQRIAADFAKAYPEIKIEFTRLVGAQMNTMLTQERLSSVDGGDVVLTNETLWLEDRAKENALLPVTALPAFKGWPAKHIIGSTIPTLSLEPFAMLYNKQLVKTPITGYQDLLRPEFKGKLGTTGVQAVTIVAWYEWLEKTQGADFLARFAAQAPKVFTGAVPNAQSTASGEIAATAFSVPTVVLPLAEKGAPIKMVIPNPALGFSYYAAIVANSRRPNASQVLLDYMMSPRGQAAWHSRGESASPLPNIQGSADANTIQQLDSRPYTANSVNEYRKKWESIFTR